MPDAKPWFPEDDGVPAKVEVQKPNNKPFYNKIVGWAGGALNSTANYESGVLNSTWGKVAAVGAGAVAVWKALGDLPVPDL
jgi:hypothetical protein